MVSPQDIHFMTIALSLAKRGLGRCGENPSVGCVIAKDTRILAAAHTADGGRPHAETIALEKCNEKAKGATAYVTLEPCAHHGKTPPCAKALIEAGISRVVIGTTDPDPRVSGQGIAMLEQAGIEVETGICEGEAREGHKGFISRITQNRPEVTLKLASTLDGKIATVTGESQWITNEFSRTKLHQYRAAHDAILCGVGTVLADNPALTTRVEALTHSPIRIVLDRHLRLPLDCQLVKTAKDVPVWIFYQKDPQKKSAALKKVGVKLFQSTENTIKSVLSTLAGQGVNRVFVEGGPTIHGAFLNENLVDTLLWFRAPLIFGADGVNSFSGYETAKINQAFALERCKTISLGQDLLEIYKRKA